MDDRCSIKPMEVGKCTEAEVANAETTVEKSHPQIKARHRQKPVNEAIARYASPKRLAKAARKQGKSEEEHGVQVRGDPQPEEGEMQEIIEVSWGKLLQLTGLAFLAGAALFFLLRWLIQSPTAVEEVLDAVPSIVSNTAGI